MRARTRACQPAHLLTPAYLEIPFRECLTAHRPGCRPLPEALLRYARTDVHYLLYIADCLGLELARRDAAAAQGLEPAVAKGQRQAELGLQLQQGGAAEAGEGRGPGENGCSAGGAEPAAAAGGPAPPGTPLFRQLLPGTRLWHAVQRSQVRARKGMELPTNSVAAGQPTCSLCSIARSDTVGKNKAPAKPERCAAPPSLACPAGPLAQPLPPALAQSGR